MSKHSNLQAYCQAHGVEKIRIDGDGYGEPTVETWNQPLADKWIVSFVGHTAAKTSEIVTEWANSLAVPIEAFAPDFIAPKSLDDAYDNDNDGFEELAGNNIADTLSKHVGSTAVSKYTPANAKLYPHYFVCTGNATHLDVFMIAELAGLNSWYSHMLKRVLAAGRRGAKDEEQDLKELIATAQSRLEFIENFKNGDC